MALFAEMSVDHRLCSPDELVSRRDKCRRFLLMDSFDKGLQDRRCHPPATSQAEHLALRAPQVEPAGTAPSVAYRAYLPVDEQSRADCLFVPSQSECRPKCVHHWQAARCWPSMPVLSEQFVAQAPSARLLDLCAGTAALRTPPRAR